jgi:hypothetical protein
MRKKKQYVIIRTYTAGVGRVRMKKRWTLDEKLRIVGRLYHLRLRRRIPPVYVDDEILRMETSPGVRVRITWDQAARIAKGTSLERVIGRTMAAK